MKAIYSLVYPKLNGGAAVLLGLLLIGSGGCASTDKLEVPVKSAFTGLSPVNERITDQAMARDEAWFTKIEQQIDALPEEASSRPVAKVWLQASRAEYALTSREPFIDDAAAKAYELSADPETASTLLQAWQAWIAHRRGVSGFRAALPLIRLADEAMMEAPYFSAADTPGQDARPDHLPHGLFELQTRLAQLHDQEGVPVDSYAWAKAQAWLDFALDEYFQRDRSGIVSTIAAHTEGLLEALSAAVRSQSANELLVVATANPRFGGSADYEPEWWEMVYDKRVSLDSNQLFYRDPLLSALARLEVQLIQAGLAHEQRGWRAARPYLEVANKLAHLIENYGTKPTTSP